MMKKKKEVLYKTSFKLYDQVMVSIFMVSFFNRLLKKLPSIVQSQDGLLLKSLPCIHYCRWFPVRILCKLATMFLDWVKWSVSDKGKNLWHEVQMLK